MPRYQYAGLGPVDDGQGGIVRPGDIRDTEPDWGPWAEIPDGEPGDGPEKAPRPPAVPAPATERARPATAATAPASTTPAPAAEGN